MPKDLKISLLIDIYGSLLNEKQYLLADYYYNEDLSLSEIAELEGITRQGVHDIIKRTAVQLNEYEEKLKFLSIKNSLKTAADRKDFNEILQIIEQL